MCLRPRDSLSADENAALVRTLVADEPLNRGYQLLQRFPTLLRTCDLTALEPWLVEAEESTCPPS